MKKLMDLLFGSKPPIFNKQAQVEHHLDKKSWDNWNNRYQQGAEYDWRRHEGMTPARSSKFNS